MPGSYIERSLSPHLKKAAREFPVVVLTGPRQSGKTTLLKHLFAKSHGYVSMDLPDVQAAAESDPRGFLELNPPPVIFDEIQYAPGLLPYIKEIVDADRKRRGGFLLSGSQNILLAERTTETLAGRTAVLRLLPLSLQEQLGRPAARLPWESGYRPPDMTWSGSDLRDSLLRGGYPELVSQPGRDVFLWQAGYTQTYLERDVRTLRQVGDLTLFQNFLRALAARSAQLLNLTDMARDLGIAVNTAKAWLSVLEATYQVLILRPYFANVGKRLVKTPKVYFLDTGSLCYLTGLKDAEHAVSGPMGGAVFETAVVGEIYKTLVHRGEEPRLYFWRTASGMEVDVIVESGGVLVPVEAKLSSTPRPAMAKGIGAFRSIMGDKSAAGFVVHSGDILLPLGDGSTALPIARL
jgi:predicted AAA+ superfamily ATPase